MVKERKKADQNRKITSLEVDEDVLYDQNLDFMLKESLMREADELEEVLTHDAALRGVGASDDMFEAIVEELRARKLWEEERDGGSAAFEKERTEQKERERIRRQKNVRWKKYSGIAASVCLAVVGLSMTSEANRRLVFKAWDGLAYNFNYRFPTHYSEEGSVRSKTEEEIMAIADIEKRLGAPAIDFEYLPKGMEYLGYEILDDNKDAYMFFSWGEKVFNVSILYMPNTEQDGAAYFTLKEGAAVIEKVNTEQNLEIGIFETDKVLGKPMYTAELLYDDFRYLMNGIDSLEEIKKIAKYTMIF